MRSKKRLALIGLMVLTMVACLIGAVACGGGVSASDAIKMYILPQDQQLIEKDFTLPKKIGKDNAVSVTWTSDNTAAIAIEEGTDANNYNAKVTLQAEVTPVKLTISAGSASKDFTVRVDELSVYTFIDNFTFAQKGTAVSKDFTLETSTQYKDKTATISWTADTEYHDFINIDQAGTKAVVTPGDDIADVQLKATFSYTPTGSTTAQTATQPYALSVAPELEGLQRIFRFYSRSDYPVEISGRVLYIVEAKEDATYGLTATFFMMDEETKCGYYMYQVGLKSKADLENFKEGAYVSVKGNKTTCYSGLWETTGKQVGTGTVDTSKEAINPRDYVYDFDVDVLSRVPSALWRESTYVKLNGWKVEYVKNNGSPVKATKTDSTLFNLTNKVGDTTITIPVRLSKYVIKDDAVLNGILALYDTIPDGSIVNVTGLLGCYTSGDPITGLQIQPVTASDIVKTDATEATSYPDASTLKTAVAAVQKEVDKNFTDKLITGSATQTYTMPTTSGDVAISYHLAGKSVSSPTVSINGGTFTVKPIKQEKNYDIQVTYTLNQKTYYSFFRIHNWDADARDLVDTVKKSLRNETISDISDAGEHALLSDSFLTHGTTITWSVRNAPDYPWLTIVGNKAKVLSLPREATDITFVATISCGNATPATVNFKVKVAAALTAMLEEASPLQQNVDYVYGLYQANLGKWLYSTGLKDGNFGATTEDPAKAAKYVLTQATDGWTIKVHSAGNTNDGKFLELNDDHQITYVATSTAKWTWDDTLKVFTWTKISGKVYYVGTYSTFTTFSASETKYLTGGSNFRGIFGTVSTMDNEAKANWIVDHLEDIPARITATNGDGLLLNTYNSYDATAAHVVTWSLNSTDDNSSTYAALNDGNKLQIKNIPTDATEYHYTLTASVTVGEGGDAKTATRNFIFVVAKPNDGSAELPYTPSEAIVVAKALSSGNFSTTQVYVKGYVVDAGSWSASFGNWSNVYVGDTATTAKDDALLVYYLKPDSTGGGHLLADDLSTKSAITVYGYLQNYNGTAEMAKKDNDYPTAKAYTDSRTDAQKAEAAAKAAKATLDALTVPFGTDTITAPASTVTGVTLDFKVGTTALAQYTVTHGAQESTVDVTITATLNSATKSETATVKIAQRLAAGTGNLELTKASITKLSGDGKAYADYDGVHEAVNQSGYSIVTSDVMVSKQGSYDVIQFKASTGKIMLTGSFTKVTIVFVSTNEATHNANKLTVKADGVECAAGTATTQAGEGDYKLYTVEYTITGTGEKLISVEKTVKNATYVQSITFTAAT